MNRKIHTNENRDAGKKNKGMSHTEIVVIVATFVIIGVVTSFFVLSKDRYTFVPQNEISAPETAGTLTDNIPEIPPSEQKTDNEETALAYRQQVVDIIKVYNPTSLNYEAAVKAYRGVVDQLLSLKVPENYQEVHLRLVGAFEKLATASEKALEGDSDGRRDLSAARGDLEKIFEKYPWLRS